jgi:hypothetical protein
MTRAPDRAAIHAAELRVAHSVRNTRDSLRRVPVELRSAFTRPSVVMLAMGAAGVLGFSLAGRSRTGSSSSDSVGASPAPVPSHLAVFVARFGMYYLSAIFRQVWAGREAVATRDCDQVLKSTATASSETALLS